MGKDRRGRECGKGIVQKKNGEYAARYYDALGKRHEKLFKTLPEARKWRVQAIQNAEVPVNPDVDMTVDEWFLLWTENLICDLAPNTIRNYKERYNRNIKPVIGMLKMIEVRPMHCKKVLNDMNLNYAGSTIRQTYICMGTMFKAALMNGIIPKHPMDGVRYSRVVKSKGDIHFLTISEQKQFLEAAKRSHNYRQYALILETGLRTGELIGLTFDDINWEDHTLTICKTLEYRHEAKTWRAGPPKTKNSYRTIPLTDRAYEILKSCYDERSFRYESDTLSKSLDYIDSYSGDRRQLVFRDLVFINFRTGMPNKNSSYDTHLYKLCDEAGIERFCMHALRHTYATRAIENGMPPKVLQKLLGHANLSTTMDTYVHVTDDSMSAAVKNFNLSMRAIESSKQIEKGCKLGA